METPLTVNRKENIKKAESGHRVMRFEQGGRGEHDGQQLAR